MRKRILKKFAVVLFASCLIGMPIIATPAEGPKQRPWHFSDLFTNGHNLWPAISRELTLEEQYNENSYVKKQILWFRKQQDYLIELTRNSKPYIYYVLEQTRKRGMPAIIALLPMIESNYSPFQNSRRGAVGLWQFMPGTASGFGLVINWWYDGRRDVVASTNAALNYLQYLHDYFHSWLLAIAAYDAGEGTVISAIHYNKRHHRATDFWALPLPYETKVYVPKLLALANIIKNHNQYGLHLVPVENRPFFTTVTLQKQVNLSHLAKMADASPKTMKHLNPGFRRETTAPNRTYHILVPVAKADTLAAHLADLHARPTHTTNYSQGEYHRVRSGDSLSLLASRYHTSIREIRNLNKLKSNIIVIGENLLVPEAHAETFRDKHLKTFK